VREHALYLVLLALAAAMPVFLPHATATQAAVPDFPGFPAPFGSAAMPALPLAPQERAFLRHFPGKVGLFGTHDSRHIVRWITATTRRLHPASDCFRASGYAISNEPHCPAAAEGCFIAERAGQRVLVSEQIRDRAGQTFHDVSAWYWAASRGSSTGPWWSITTIRAAHVRAD
jgi:hypothetical protein